MEPNYIHAEELQLDKVLGRVEENSSMLEQKVAEAFARFREPVCRYLLGLTGNSSLVEDLTQETFLRLYASLRQQRAVTNLRSWLFRVAHNLAMSQYRKKDAAECADAASWEWASQCKPDPAPNAEATLLAEEQHAWLSQALRRLSEQERNCLNLRAEGLRYREIGEVLGISTQTVVTFLNRGIKKITREIHE